MAFSCTAGSAVIGEDRVAELMRVSHPDARCTNPVTAVKTAFEALSVKRVSILTPYVDEINREIVAFLNGAGVEIADFGAFGVSKETEIATISPERVKKAALDLDHLVRVHVRRARRPDAVVGSSTHSSAETSGLDRPSSQVHLPSRLMSTQPQSG